MKLKTYSIYISLFCFILASLVVGCALLMDQPTPSEKAALKRIAPSQYPEFFDDMSFDGLEHAMGRSLAYLNKLPPDRLFQFGPDRFQVGHMIKSIEKLSTFIQTRPSNSDLNRFLAENFLVYQSVGAKDSGRVLFTGYYEPVLRGSLQHSDQYKFPVYGKPGDLTTINLYLFDKKFKKGQTLVGRHTENQTVVPYYERSEIEKGNLLQGKSDVIAWVDSRIDLFFLEIQGSGKISLDNGNTINVLYHAKNGRPYRSIGRLLIKQGKIPAAQMSMQRIKSYLQNHPEEVDNILNYNPSYVFFRQAQEGPFGCYGTLVTPGRSIALQKRIFPPAALAFIDTRKPLLDESGQIYRWSKLSRFVLNQDTGGAIKGPGRADIYWGSGPYAEVAAGHMKHEGKLFFLMLKPESNES